MFAKVLVANRGEITRRIVKTCRRMGIASVAVASEANRFSAGVIEAYEHAVIGPAPASPSYLDIDAMIAVCRRTGAETVHPGYGFPPENAGFAERLAEGGSASSAFAPSTCALSA